MSLSQSPLDGLNLESLNDQDKAEIRQFLNKQQQRSQIQARTCSNGSRPPPAFPTAVLC
jgi:hypothetical protein